MVAGTFALVAALPLLILSVYYAISSWDSTFNNASHHLSDLYSIELYRSVVLAVVVVPLCVSLWRASMPAAILGLIHTPLVGLLLWRWSRMLSDLGFLTGALHVLAGTAGVLVGVSHTEPMALASVGGMAARLAAAL